MKQLLRRKPLIILSLTGITFVVLAGFFYFQKTSFRSFCNEIFITEMEQDTLGLHYTIAHPEDFGIKQKEASLPLYEKKEALDSYETLQTHTEKLQTFDPEKLSVEERYTQNLLIHSLSEELNGKQYFYLQEMFSPSGGIQIQYPILMAEYTFRCKDDIEDYLALLKMTPEYFSSYNSFTKEKVARGYGMADFALKKVISQCQTIITREEIQEKKHFLVTTFDERLQKAVQDGIITETESENYRKINTEYLTLYVLKAYENLAKNMESFLGTGKNNDGLCAFKQGKDYYSWLFKRTTGSDTPLEDAYMTLAKDYYNSIEKLRSDLIAFQNTASLTDAEYSYFTLDESDDMLENLMGQMEQDFPSVSATFNIPALPATVKDVSPSLEKFTAPAYYLVPPIDDNSRNSIYINQASAPCGLELYTTLAHEGYPGHLYQTTYYQLYREAENLPYLRSTLNFGGYVEGWALYVELLSYEYASNLLVNDTGKEDYRLLFDIYKQERCASLALLSLLDIGIHYYGMDLARVTELLNDHGITDADTIRGIYEYIIEEPCNYPKYYWGNLEILTLKDLAKKEMGAAYSDYAFHKFFLECGPSDFTSLAERLKEE